MLRIAKFLIFIGIFLASAVITAAQGPDLRKIESPLQEEFDFRIGQILGLNLHIDGIKWTVLKADAGDMTRWTAGKTTKTSFTNELENLTDTPLILSIILLLEDDRGRQLERVELKRIKVGPGRYTQAIQKIKIDGGNLADTAKVYIFAEVE
ncbi:MAG: hypothetical protein DRJ61_03860 [Acidobacteria bacterium]|nr:MAG: hypothetical protein DRJ65_21870 [Acidobacteriota bacterium]RLE35122.1 MAG: hypothetical protein DRJ61_03860 [Acidobacteriota bacterium]